VALGAAAQRAALLGLPELAKLALGLDAGKAAAVGGADATVELAAVERAPAPIVGAVLARAKNSLQASWSAEGGIASPNRLD
jgi:hypothetical protein